jgi:hypothetical protein
MDLTDRATSITFLLRDHDFRFTKAFVAGEEASQDGQDRSLRPVESRSIDLTA